ncbi:LLM class flavin-dependent oxidoreductase [Streptomyces flaveus]|uniref:LLM class flavin-dependent oxidoreductase n=1 Tax=Streptomyces flaveus TaxID=66370 RepID=UPI0004CBBEAB|nr:LLM class flavin-dependent oxidoreductase [Streptomyces flaveus]
MSATPFDIGVNSFGEVATDDGRVLDDAETVRLLVEEAALAEASGLDVFSVGEHYRAGHVDSATPVLLAAMATATERIRLGTSVTVLSTNDPVRLYQEFSTLDAVSGGRAQLVLGRASATESFPLFGYDIADYEQLFEEKLELFMRLRREETVTWSGAFRAPLTEQRLTPRMRSGGIPTWIGVGGSPHPQPVGQHSLGLVADTDEEAVETWWRYWQPVVTALAEERGFYAPTRARYEAELADGALYVGSPETVARKIARTARDLHLSRFDLKYDVMRLPRQARARTIELLGREVAPRVRELLSDEPAGVRPGTAPR